MSVPLWIWLVTSAVILGFFIFDFVSHVRSPHEPSLKESGSWSAFYVTISLAFGGVIWFLWDTEHAVQFYTGYVTELALSVDNLFVFALIMGTFKIPRRYQQKVLLIGIVLALLFRLIFILLGAAIIEAWSDVFYLFAIFLLYTAIKLFYDEVADAEETDPKDMWVVKFINKIVPVSHRYHRDHLWIRKAGKLTFTPLFVALLAIGMIDIMFAFDSIPAIFGITQEPFLVFTTNALALMGLRQMYFLIDGLLDRLVYLPYGLALILGFIGLKLLLHALHENNLSFINGGEDIAVPEVSTVLSLLVIVGVLTVTVIASLIKNARDKANGVANPKMKKTDYDDFGNKHNVDEHGNMIDANGNILDWDGNVLENSSGDVTGGHAH